VRDARGLLLDFGDADARRILDLYRCQVDAEVSPRVFMLQALRARSTDAALQRLIRRIEALSNLKAAQLQAYCQGHWDGQRAGS